jgi:hypothetical protein
LEEFREDGLQAKVEILTVEAESTEASMATGAGELGGNEEAE